jgi:hypothetical protein
MNQNRLINSGVRIPITNLDANMVLILKQIFSNYYDGLIAPKLITPFELSGYSHEEIIIFDTDALEIVQDQNININQKYIGQILGKNMKFYTMNVYTGVIKFYIIMLIKMNHFMIKNGLKKQLNKLKNNLKAYL